MPVISLAVRYVDYVSDQGFPVRAQRAYAQTSFRTSGNLRVPCRCVVDSGAPFCVIPYSLWHGRKLNWSRLGKHLLRTGSNRLEKLEWQGIACALGETLVYLVDANARVEVGPFLVIGKFADRRHPRPDVEGVAVLGLNFLTDNKEVLTLDGTRLVVAGKETLTGTLAVP
jgi:hypothetical protein